MSDKGPTVWPTFSTTMPDDGAPKKVMNDGGPAFPSIQMLLGGKQALISGMSLRDYFASAALTGLLFDPNFCAGYNLVPETKKAMQSQYAYELADAMIAEQDKGR